MRTVVIVILSGIATLAAATYAFADPPPVVTPLPPPEVVREPFDDARTLTIVHFANSAEVDQAKLALLRSKDTRVRKLAKMVVTDHVAADKEGMALMSANKLAITSSPVAKDLQTDADRTSLDLRALRGAAFDRAYVDAQVKQHVAVLKLVDDDMLPAVGSGDVKVLLSAIRPKLAMHLEHARQVQDALARTAR